MIFLRPMRSESRAAGYYRHRQAGGHDPEQDDLRVARLLRVQAEDLGQVEGAQDRVERRPDQDEETRADEPQEASLAQDVDAPGLAGDREPRPPVRSA